MNIERKIEDAMVTRLLARTYISTNSIPVRRWDDRATKDTNLIAVVHAMPVSRLQPNCNLYNSVLIVGALNNSEHDVEGDTLALLYQDILDEIMNDMTAVALTASIGDASVVVDGVVHEEGTIDAGDEYKIQGAQARLFITYTP
jgi:hypothetical protein